VVASIGAVPYDSKISQCGISAPLWPTSWDGTTKLPRANWAIVPGAVSSYVSLLQSTAQVSTYSVKSFVAVSLSTVVANSRSSQ
jgi:hypothetical protein